jgi:hypothetical protein
VVGGFEEIFRDAVLAYEKKTSIQAVVRKD